MMEVRIITWLDSLGGVSWEPLEDIRAYRPLEIHTAGFVIDESDEHVTILQSYDERANGKPHGDHVICIPKFAIREMRTLT